MDIAREVFDEFYDLMKPVIFRATDNDPRIARDSFVKFCRWMYSFGLDGLVLDNETNYYDLRIKISNAAGFNKNARLPPRVLKLFGFDKEIFCLPESLLNSGEGDGDHFRS